MLDTLTLQSRLTASRNFAASTLTGAACASANWSLPVKHQSLLTPNFVTLFTYAQSLFSSLFPFANGPLVRWPLLLSLASLTKA